jgi:hypothetical protein
VGDAVAIFTLYKGGYSKVVYLLIFWMMYICFKNDFEIFKTLQPPNSAGEKLSRKRIFTRFFIWKWADEHEQEHEHEHEHEHEQEHEHEREHEYELED